MSGAKKDHAVQPCSVYNWLKAYDKDFAEVIEDLCLERLMSSSITFLYPKDPEFRNKIIAEATKDADKAVKMIESLIVPVVIASAAEFGRHAPNIGNRLGFKFEGVTVKGASVVCDKFELEPLKEFSPRASSAGRVAVWAIKSGHPPMSGAAYSIPAPVRHGKARKTGGAEVQGRHAVADRIARHVEEAYRACMRSENKCRDGNPYLGAVVGLLNHMKAHRPEALKAVLPVLDWNPVTTFYLILEPFKTSGAYLVPECCLPACSTPVFTDAVAEYKEYFDRAGEMFGSGEVPKAFSDRAGVTAATDAVRRFITQGAPVRAPEHIKKAYESLMADNSVGGLGGVLPRETAAAISAEKKLWQDELRFILDEALKDISHRYEDSAFSALIEDLRTRYPGNDYAAELTLSNVIGEKIIAPKLELMLLCRFVNSTSFLYVSCREDAVGPYVENTDPRDWCSTVYNGIASSMQFLSRTTEMAQPEGLPPGTLRALETFYAKYKRLPTTLEVLREGQQ
jgi:hypothetical protein